MAVATKLITADDLLAMPNDRRRELVCGEVREMAPAGADHGDVTNNFSVLLTTHVKANKLGKVFAAETGFVLRRSPDTVRAADCSFVSHKRIEWVGGVPKGFFPTGPDLAVEVVSPNDTLTEVEAKVDEWIAAGASAAVVINPARRSVTVHAAGKQPLVLRVGDTLDLSFVVPGFGCQVAEIFE
jgi:Uma2 family endonuclease